MHFMNIFQKVTIIRYLHKVLMWDGNISNLENCQISLRALHEVTHVTNHFTTDTILT